MGTSSKERAIESTITILEPHQLPCMTREAMWRMIDRLEVEMIRKPAVELPVEHRFTNATPGRPGGGVYCRTIFMPAGTLLTSKIHKTQHQYFILRGKVSVWTEFEGWVTLEAPHHGTTEPNTRRVLYIHEDTTWTTCHPTDETDVAKIEADIIESRREHIAGLVQPPPTPALEGVYQ